MENIYKENIFVEGSVSFGKEKIEHALHQIEHSICKIDNNGKDFGTGFFCKIPFPNQYTSLNVLITCNHVLNKKKISEGKFIKFSLNNDKKIYKKLIDNKRKTYTNEEEDITFIEIKPEDDEDKIISFLDVDYRIMEEKKTKESYEKIYKEYPIYIIHYKNAEKVIYSLDKIKDIELEKNNIIKIKYLCKTGKGSSGSPIISLYNYKVIGIHKGGEKYSNIKIGTLINSSINKFYKIHKKASIIKISNNQKKNNNIIFYDEKTSISLRNDLSDYFEENINGNFFLCTKIKSLSLLKKEIINENKNDNKIIFNIITTGNSCENLLKFLKKKKVFKKCINKICISNENKNELEEYKTKYKNEENVTFINKYEDTKGFILETSLEGIKPYPRNIITLKDYKNKYKERHNQIAQFYGKKLDTKNFEFYFQKIQSLIKIDKNLINKKKEDLIKAFLKFKNEKELIIREYTRSTFYKDLNRWLTNPNDQYYDAIAYFASIFMNGLNSFAIENEKFYNENEQYLYKGFNLPYSSLLQYESSIGRIITFTIFISTIKNKKETKEYFNDKKIKSKFKTIFFIKNIYKKNWISNAINVKSESEEKIEEFVFLPFSFFRVKDVQIDINDFSAEVYLETIGKTEILEYQIQNGNEIDYNEMYNIME